MRRLASTGPPTLSQVGLGLFKFCLIPAPLKLSRGPAHEDTQRGDGGHAPLEGKPSSRK